MSARATRLVAVAAIATGGFVARIPDGATGPPPPPDETRATAVACLAERRCLSVGSIGPVFLALPFAASLLGAQWEVRSPELDPTFGDSELSAIACRTPTSCMAVGGRDVIRRYFGDRTGGERPVAAEWDGTTWRLTPVELPRRVRAAKLYGVDCTSSTCMAVGAYERGQAGRGWALAEVWDGNRWTLRLPPQYKNIDDAVLEDVDCVADDLCVAVGYFNYELEGLATFVTPLVELWDGRRWKVWRSASPREQALSTQLEAVECARRNSCIAVGYERDRAGDFSPVAETWDGKAWQLLPMKGLVSKFGDAAFLDVACPVADECLAVGVATSESRVGTLAALWNGRRWTLQPTPNPDASSSAEVTAIDCVGPSWCQAVGTFTRDSPINHAFSMAWDGQDWTLLEMPGSA